MRQPTPKELEAANRFNAFFRGWTHACGGRPRDEAFTCHINPVIREEYEAGYKAGLLSRRGMTAELIARTGHRPTVLRAMTDA
jgi:hypothetical protein